MLANKPEGLNGVFRRMGYTALLPLLRLPHRRVLTELPEALAAAGAAPDGAAQASASALVAFALRSPAEFWAGLAIRWLEDGFPIDSDILSAGDELIHAKRGTQLKRHTLSRILRRWKRFHTDASGPDQSMSSNIGVRLISRPLMADLCARFDGITSKAWHEMTPETGSPPEGMLKLSLYPYDDSRYGYAIVDTLGRAFAEANESHSKGRDSLLRLLSFYHPLSASSGFPFDDSGGSARAIGPVLAPERCQYVLDYWLTVETRAAEEELNRYSLFFDLAERPHAKFQNGAALLALLGRYASFMDQAVASDSFYFSYDGNSL